MTIDYDLTTAFKEYPITEMEKLETAISEIIRCSSEGVIDAETAQKMRDHILAKKEPFAEMIEVIKKAERIYCHKPVTGPMGRKTPHKQEELTDREKEVFLKLYNDYYAG